MGISSGVICNARTLTGSAFLCGSIRYRFNIAVSILVLSAVVTLCADAAMAAKKNKIKKDADLGLIIKTQIKAKFFFYADLLWFILNVRTAFRRV